MMRETLKAWMDKADAFGKEHGGLVAVVGAVASVLAIAAFVRREQS